MVTLTALKWTGVSPTDGSLVEATTVRAVDGAGGGVCPTAGAASTAAQTRKLPSVVDRMSLSLNEVILGKVWRQPAQKVFVILIRNWTDLILGSRCIGTARSACRTLLDAERALSIRRPKPTSLSHPVFTVFSFGPPHARPIS